MNTIAQHTIKVVRTKEERNKADTKIINIRESMNKCKETA
jgi:hypothetical protein